MNYLLPAAKQALLEKRVDWRTDPIFGVLVNAGTYTFSLNHASLADVPAWARLSTSGTLTGRTTTGGVADADDVRFSGYVGPNAQVIALFNGSNESALFMCYLDTAQGLPVEGNGNPAIIHWDNGTRRIFAL
jgi:hypothetical protein